MNDECCYGYDCDGWEDWDDRCNFHDEPQQNNYEKIIKKLVDTIMSYNTNIIDEVIKQLCENRGIEIMKK
jgi:hypothetical protein